MIIKKQRYVCKTLATSAFLMGILAFSAVQAQTAAPTLSGLGPNARNFEWYHREQQAFIHFNMNTFTNSEWGTGHEDEKLFNPTNLDCGQWCRTLKAAGMTSAILTIKHHDGFCLWPSAYTAHCVKNSTNWKGGKGDVLREFTDSCHKYGIKACIYLSPWDMHQSSPYYDNTPNPNPEHLFPTAAYVDYYCNQLVELLKNKPYGPLYEIWWDGAGMDALGTAPFQRWADTVHKYMPECVIWGTKKAADVCDIRWVGNEGGTAGDPCWSTVNRSDVAAENGVPNTGNPNGDAYLPAETNTSISNNGWYWHSGETAKSVSGCWDLYFTSVARNTVLLLNFPPNTKGWMSTSDSTSGAGMGNYMYGTFKTNLLAGAGATALHPRGTGFEPANMLDNCEDTYFASADASKTDTITFKAASAITFDCVMLQEVIKLGHRSLNWSVDYSSDGNSWTTISAANNKQCIGFKRAVKWSPATTATQVRLRITNGKACPAIHTFGVYKQAQVTPPASWNGLGPVTACTTSTKIGAALHQAAAGSTSRILRIARDLIVLPADFGTEPVVVNIFDIQGHCVLHAVAPGNGFEQRLALTSLKSGSYLVRCTSDKWTMERKFMNLR